MPAGTDQKKVSVLLTLDANGFIRAIRSPVGELSNLNVRLQTSKSRGDALSKTIDALSGSFTRYTKGVSTAADSTGRLRTNIGGLTRAIDGYISKAEKLSSATGLAAFSKEADRILAVSKKTLDAAQKIGSSGKTQERSFEALGSSLSSIATLLQRLSGESAKATRDSITDSQKRQRQYAREQESIAKLGVTGEQLTLPLQAQRGLRFQPTPRGQLSLPFRPGPFRGFPALGGPNVPGLQSGFSISSAPLRAQLAARQPAFQQLGLPFGTAGATTGTNAATAAVTRLTGAVRNFRTAKIQATTAEQKNALQLRELTAETINGSSGFNKLTGFVKRFFAVFVGFKLIGIFKEALTSAVDFLSTIERTTLGVAEVVSVSNRFVDALGQVLPIGDQINLSFVRAHEAIGKIVDSAVQLGIPVKETIRQFIVLSGVATKANVSLDDQLEILRGVVVLAQRADIPFTQLARSIDNLFTGLRVGQTQLGVILGVNQKIIETQKEQGTLAKFYIDRLQIVTALLPRNLDTYEGIKRSIQAIFDVLSSKIFGGAFVILEQSARELRDRLVELSENKDAILDINRAFTEIAESIREVADRLIQVFQLIKDNKTTVSTIAGFFAGKSAIGGLAGGATGAVIGGTLGGSVSGTLDAGLAILGISLGTKLIGSIATGALNATRSNQNLAKLGGALAAQGAKNITKSAAITRLASNTIRTTTTAGAAGLAASSFGVGAIGKIQSLFGSLISLAAKSPGWTAAIAAITALFGALIIRGIQDKQQAAAATAAAEKEQDTRATIQRGIRTLQGQDQPSLESFITAKKFGIGAEKGFLVSPRELEQTAADQFGLTGTKLTDAIQGLLGPTLQELGKAVFAGQLKRNEAFTSVFEAQKTFAPTHPEEAAAFDKIIQALATKLGRPITTDTSDLVNALTNKFKELSAESKINQDFAQQRGQFGPSADFVGPLQSHQIGSEFIQIAVQLNEQAVALKQAQLGLLQAQRDLVSSTRSLAQANSELNITRTNERSIIQRQGTIGGLERGIGLFQASQHQVRSPQQLLENQSIVNAARVDIAERGVGIERERLSIVQKQLDIANSNLLVFDQQENTFQAQLKTQKEIVGLQVRGAELGVDLAKSQALTAANIAEQSAKASREAHAELEKTASDITFTAVPANLVALQQFKLQIAKFDLDAAKDKGAADVAAKNVQVATNALAVAGKNSAIEQVRIKIQEIDHLRERLELEKQAAGLDNARLEQINNIEASLDGVKEKILEGVNATHDLAESFDLVGESIRRNLGDSLKAIFSGEGSFLETFKKGAKQTFTDIIGKLIDHTLDEKLRFDDVMEKNLLEFIPGLGKKSGKETGENLGQGLTDSAGGKVKGLFETLKEKIFGPSKTATTPTPTVGAPAGQVTRLQNQGFSASQISALTGGGGALAPTSGNTGTGTTAAAGGFTGGAAFTAYAAIAVAAIGAFTEGIKRIKDESGRLGATQRSVLLAGAGGAVAGSLDAIGLGGLGKPLGKLISKGGFGGDLAIDTLIAPLLFGGLPIPGLGKSGLAEKTFEFLGLFQPKTRGSILKKNLDKLLKQAGLPQQQAVKRDGRGGIRTPGIEASPTLADRAAFDALGFTKTGAIEVQTQGLISGKTRAQIQSAIVDILIGAGGVFGNLFSPNKGDPKGALKLLNTIQGGNKDVGALRFGAGLGIGAVLGPKPRDAAVISNALINNLQALGVSVDEARRQLLKIASKSGIDIVSGLEDLNKKFLEGTFNAKQFISSATGLADLFENGLRTGVDLATIALDNFNEKGGLDITNFTDQVKNAIDLITTTVPQFLTDSVKSGDLFGAGQTMGQTIVNGLLKQFSDEIVKNTVIGGIITQVSSLVGQAAKAFAAGDTQQGRTLLDSARKNFFDARGLLARITAEIGPTFFGFANSLGVPFPGGAGIINPTGAGFPGFDTPSFIKVPGVRGQPFPGVMHGGETVRTPEQDDRIVVAVNHLTKAIMSRQNQPINLPTPQVFISPSEFDKAMSRDREYQRTGRKSTGSKIGVM